MPSHTTHRQKCKIFLRCGNVTWKSQGRDILHFLLKTKLSFLAGIVTKIMTRTRCQLNASMDVFGQRKEICISRGFIFVANFIDNFN